MINLSIIEGRLTKDVELKMTQSNNKYCRFVVAVDRGGKDKGADFISCIAWNQTAELIYKYFSKGSPIALEGNIRTSSFEGKNGKTFSTDVNVYKVHFPLTNKPKEQSENTNLKVKDMNVEDSFDSKVEDTFGVVPEDLPF